jgi:pilus assembly protein CpaC
MFARQSRFGTGLVALAVTVASPALVSAQGPAATRNSSAALTAVQDEDIALNVGEQRVVPSDNVRSYSEGVRGVVDVRLTKDGSEFIVVALRPGATTLLLLMMDGSERHLRITVEDPNAPKRGKGSGAVEARDNIRLDFYFVQVSKSYGHQLGLGFPGSVAPTFSAAYDIKAGNLESATAVIESQALPRLDMAQSSGWAKVMRQAAVVTANGEKASFSGGGEVNVPIQSALTSGVQKIEFGSKIEVEPVYDSRSGRIELRLHADISELDSDRGTGIPGRITAGLDTIVNLELGQSLILGGLTARSERTSKSGFPGLSQIPIFGMLFGSHGHTEDESENVVLIVPTVVDAVSMQDRARLDDALRRYTEYSGDLDEVDLVPAAKSPQRSPVAPASSSAVPRTP